LSPRRIDARGMRCPWPAIRLARAMREDGEPIWLAADDPAAPAEIAALAAAQGWRIEPGEAEGTWIVHAAPPASGSDEGLTIRKV